MKLVNKINIRFGIVALSTTLLLGITLVIALRLVFNEQVDEKLDDTYKYITTLLQRGDTVTSFPPFFTIDVIPHRPDTIFYTDAEIDGFDAKHGEIFRHLSAINTINGNTYLLQFRESQMETDDFYETIIAIILISIAIFILILFIVNRKVSNSIWEGFYKNQRKLQSFSISNQSGLKFKNTGITEFEELNRVLEKMSAKIVRDYKNLKQFSEDASHELQTPLAVIRAKLEALLNENQLTTPQLEKIKTIYETVNRLTRLNKDLLLLTKLENNQYTGEENISVNLLFKEKLDEWQEIIALNNLRIEFDNRAELNFRMNRNLAEILVSNLLSNALNHNVSHGTIKVFINETNLIISNTGQSDALHPQVIFNRFYKRSSGKKSIGLGLSITKRICENSNLGIDYSFTENMHYFTIYPL